MKGVLTERPDRTSPLGRPRMLWIDHILEDLGRLCSELGMAKDRNLKRHVVCEAKIHLGIGRPQE